MDIDLAKFFDTVDHDKLMTIFGRTIKAGDVISVVRKFLVSGGMIDDEYEDTIVGTPQRLSFSREYVIYYRGKIVGRVYDDCFLVKPVRG